MMTVYAYMSPRRREQIQAALAQWKIAPVERKYRTHCQAKHPYSGTNLIIRKDGARVCRECCNAAQRRWYGAAA